MDIERKSRSRSPSSRQDRNGGDSKFGDCPPSNKLYLTFLPEDIEEDILRDAFEPFGSVNRIKIIKKDDGFTLAFLDMGSVEEAERALQKMNRYKIGDKSIRVQFAREKRQDEKFGGGDRSRDNSREKGNFRNDFRNEGDTRRRFDGGEERGRGRGGRGGGGRGGDFGGRGGRDGGGRGGFRENDRGDDRGGNRDGGDRRPPLICHKCQGQGHFAKNCPGQNQTPSRFNNDRSERPKPKQEKMSQDEFSDY